MLRPFSAVSNCRITCHSDMPLGSFLVYRWPFRSSAIDTTEALFDFWTSSSLAPGLRPDVRNGPVRSTSFCLCLCLSVYCWKGKAAEYLLELILVTCQVQLSASLAEDVDQISPW